VVIVVVVDVGTFLFFNDLNGLRNELRAGKSDGLFLLPRVKNVFWFAGWSGEVEDGRGFYSICCIHVVHRLNFG
jgi:hypothetical protein